MKGFRGILPLLLLSCFAGSGFPAPPPEPLTISVSGAAPAQGSPLMVHVSTTAPADNVFLLWRGARWPLREAAPGRYEALIGVDLLAAAGPETLAAESVAGGVRSRVEKVLEIVERSFPVQELTLPKGMAEFDAPTLRRIEEEKKALDERFSRVTRPVRWAAPFLPPVEAYRPENFGSRRVINGEPRSPHTGVDLRLPEGTPVRAIADGVVVLAAEQFFGGRSIVIDHGGGVFSVYYHLQRYSVEEGRRVTRGEPIGAVGATGRATGSHLHFGVRVPGGRIDPSLLFGLPGK
ncbi:MAG: peptidase [Deltaproteobacteria bacterium]|nr:peptidase [Deltaproteobacteria bacterium]